MDSSLKTTQHCCEPAKGMAEAPAVKERRFSSRFIGLGYFAIFVMAAAFLAVGSTTLQAMAANVRTTKRQAAAAARPADVKVTILVASGCTQCYNVTNLTTGLSQSKGVKVNDLRTVDYATPEGSALVQQYDIQRIPAFIVLGETDKMMTSLPQLKSYGQLQNKDFVGVNLPAPFVEVATGKVRGEFDATFITEKQCPTCYDPTINRQALKQLSMTPRSEKTVDRLDAAGQKLVKQYRLTTTPTVILTGDLSAYGGFDQIWKNVGTIEPDGAYVFRSGQDLMGTYYDLITKKVVVPKKADASTPTP